MERRSGTGNSTMSSGSSNAGIPRCCSAIVKASLLLWWMSSLFSFEKSLEIAKKQNFYCDIDSGSVDARQFAKFRISGRL